MPTPEQIEALLIREELARRRAVKDFHYFVKLMWQVVEPTVPFEDTFTVGAIGEHLEAALDFQFGTLLITIPPRMSKTVLSGVFFPAWVWAKGGHYAGLKFMFSSLSAGLTVETSLRCRRLIESDLYQRIFKPSWRLNTDGGNRQDFFSNDVGGYRISTSVGAAATGKGADILICDDLLRAMDAYNSGAKKEVINYFKRELVTRAISPKRFVRVIICQRLAVDDLPGELLNNPTGKVVHLNFPMEFEGDKEPNGLGWVDPRNEIGELLAPARITHVELADIKRDLGLRDYNAQYQQRPTAVEGALVKRSAFNYYKVLPWDASEFKQSWDFATSEKTSADYTVGLVGARRGSQIFILDMVRGRMEFEAARQSVKALSAKHPRAIKKLIENKSAGIQVVQTLKNEILGITPTNPKGDKFSRFMSILAVLTSGNVYLPEDAPWLEDFLDEVCSFAGEGTTRHDDIVDSLSQLLFDYVSTPAPQAPTTISSAGRGRGY